MQIRLTSNDYKRRNGYKGAFLKLPANRWEIEDAKERAHIENGNVCEIHRFKDWPETVAFYLIMTEEIRLEEVNYLAFMIERMSEEEILIFDSALKIRRESDKDTLMTIKDLINMAYNLDKFEFYKELPAHFMAGVVCLQGDFLNNMSELPDHVIGMQGKRKLSEVLKKYGNGIFTEKGYLYRSSTSWNKVYDRLKIQEEAGETSVLSLL